VKVFLKSSYTPALQNQKSIEPTGGLGGRAVNMDLSFFFIGHWYWQPGSTRN